MYRRLNQLINYVILLSVFINFNVFADSLNDVQKRWQFKQAYRSLSSNNLEQFQQLSQGLENYLLYPFLRYTYLKNRLDEISPSEVHNFLRKYGDTGLGALFRRTWLHHLAKQQDWGNFERAYTPQKSAKLRCHHVHAQLLKNGATPALLNEIKKLWLVGKSQNSACDPAFDYLYSSGQVDDALVLERIRLTIDSGRKGSMKFANVLAKRLSEQNQLWITLLESMHTNPSQSLPDLSFFNLTDTLITRSMVLYGIRRLANKQVDEAYNHWTIYKNRYQFSTQQMAEIQNDLILAAIDQNDVNVVNWLIAIEKKYINEKVAETYLKQALESQNWKGMVKVFQALPVKLQNLQWRYWYARSLEKTGKNRDAQKVFKELAKERDYYGFLAADYIGTAHQMNHQSLKATATEQAQLLKILSIKMAYEFFKVEMFEHGRREWLYALEKLNTRQHEIVATLAYNWGWYDRALKTVSKIKSYDDTTLRFPMPFHKEVLAGASAQSIDLAWVYAIIRQESAFMTDVRSHAGALGLMQLMPATARLVAKKLDISLNGNSDILDISTNISLGTAYLKQGLDRFDGNYVLASAGYNAGPGRAKRWAKERGCLPADIWVELIPFTETRRYVRNILFYISIYEHKLGQKSKPMRLTLKPYETCSED